MLILLINKPKTSKNYQRQCVTFMLTQPFFGFIFNIVIILGITFGCFVCIILGVSKNMNPQNELPFPKILKNGNSY